MANSYFRFRQFTIQQGRAQFKVGTDGVLLGACADLSGAGKILDIGTGTGLIAIMCAQRSEARITAIEPESGSFRQALENVRACPWHDRIEVIETGLNEYAGSSGEKFDILISNPPYFRDSLLNPDFLKAASRHAVSLKSEDLLKASVRLLSDAGNLQVILPYEEGTIFIAEAAGYGLFCTFSIKIKPNPRGRITRMILKFEKVPSPVHESFLTIETGVRHHYTEDYKSVTKDFYLKF